MTMADTIAVMNGATSSWGTRSTRSRTDVVANFLGQSNLLRASVEGEPADEW